MNIAELLEIIKKNESPISTGRMNIL